MNRIIVTLIKLVILLQILCVNYATSPPFYYQQNPGALAPVKEIGKDILILQLGKNITLPRLKNKPLRTMDEAVDSVKGFGHKVGDGIENAWNSTVTWFKGIFGKRK